MDVLSAVKKVGILGGTFDPIHMGHLILAETAYKAFSLDQVLIMPNGNPPHKAGRVNADMAQRTKMAKLAVAGNPHLIVSDFEKTPQDYHYTYDTLEFLKRENPDTEYYFILGADSLLSFDTWMEPARICQSCTILAAARDGMEADELIRHIDGLRARYGAKIEILSTPNIDISSNMIRDRLENNETIKYYVPEAVEEFIVRQGVYRPSGGGGQLMKEMDLETCRRKLKTELDDGRFHHSEGVMYTCASLAMRYGYDIEKAQLAGILHDCAKCIPNHKKLKMCEKHGITVTEVERRNPFLLHAKLGAYIAKHEYGVKDKEVLSAIECHTTGKPAMSTLDKIVFIADYIEPGRNKAQDLPEVRQLAFIDLDQTLYKILSDTLNYLGGKSGEIDEMTVRTYEYYKLMISADGGE